MRRTVTTLVIAVALLTTACDLRPSPPDFTETTTTSTTLPGAEAVTSTTVTLPPEDERVVGTVIDVVDGDTIDIDIDGTESDLRLLGVNAPEIDECWGQEAAVALTDLIDGQQVLLVSGPEDTDSFGRLLRYVYLESDATPLFVNSHMVETGNAVALSDGSDAAATMKAYEARAFQSGYGMWATFACGDREGVTADRPVIRVEALDYDPPGPDADVLGLEFITIVNEGYDAVPMGGWTLRDESSTNRYVFDGGTVLDVGERITVSTGCDGGPDGALYWCSSQAVWNNDGDTAIILDTLGNAVVWYTY
ncbi:MAG: lamin tail domain-containing protein [Acidimicrobiia bacterium]|nr:lamin tail domain-containing protein [Acidimicrobiia bacterium]